MKLESKDYQDRITTLTTKALTPSIRQGQRVWSFANVAAFVEAVRHLTSEETAAAMLHAMRDYDLDDLTLDD